MLTGSHIAKFGVLAGISGSFVRGATRVRSLTGIAKGRGIHRRDFRVT